MQIFRLMNQIWARTKLRARGFNVEARVYRCVPIAKDMGFVEMVRYHIHNEEGGQSARLFNLNQNTNILEKNETISFRCFIVMCSVTGFCIHVSRISRGIDCRSFSQTALTMSIIWAMKKGQHRQPILRFQFNARSFFVHAYLLTSTCPSSSMLQDLLCKTYEPLLIWRSYDMLRRAITHSVQSKCKVWGYPNFSDQYKSCPTKTSPIVVEWRCSFFMLSTGQPRLWICIVFSQKTKKNLLCIKRGTSICTMVTSKHAVVLAWSIGQILSFLSETGFRQTYFQPVTNTVPSLLLLWFLILLGAELYFTHRVRSYAFEAISNNSRSELESQEPSTGCLEAVARQRPRVGGGTECGAARDECRWVS